jgi:hypothetical protein
MSQPQLVLPAQFFYIGKMLRITVVGAITTPEARRLKAEGR